MPSLSRHLLRTLRMIGVGNAWRALTYPLRKAWVEARWEGRARPRRGMALWQAFRRKLRQPRRPWPTFWMTPGPVRTVAPTERGAVVVTDHATLTLAFLAPDLLQVRWRPHGMEVSEPLPYALAKPPEAWSTPPVVTVQDERAFLLRSEALTVGVVLASAQLFVATADGHLLRADVDVGWAEGAVRHRVALAPDEPIFGLGERATSWNRRGRTHVLWNTDPAGYAVGDDPINLNIPVYVGFPADGEGHVHPYLVFYENPSYAEFDLGEGEPSVAEHRFAGGELRYYLVAGPPSRLLERYTELTGRHALPPLWMLGYQQSRWSYVPEARVRKLVEDFRRYEVPCDAIYLDIDYMDGFRCFTWDRDRFPDLPRLAADLAGQGIKLVVIIDPGIKKDPHYAVYRSGLEGGHFCTTPDGKPFHASVWPGLSAFPDFTAPRTRRWWGELYRPLVEAGIAGFWNDMNEPSAFAERGDRTLPTVVRHAMEGRGGDHAEAHNLYGMLMARATYEGVRRLRPDRRPVVITRAGWAGVQRYATSWTADNESTWDSLRLTVPMVMGKGLSGLAFTGADVGGFAGEADGELFTRWVQMAVFMPFFRAHTVALSPDQEPWTYGEPYLTIVRRFIQLRYELLPYLYTATWQMATRGWPMVRPLWWHDVDDAALWEVDDAFLCGDALLVAPVGYPGAVERGVRLPAGGWYDFWTNRYHGGGGEVRVAAPLETMPLFVREGAVLPLGEVGPNVARRPQKFLRLAVYPLREAGRTVSELYEDAGEGFCYREGAYRLSRFTLEQEEGRLRLHWAREGGYVPPYEHIELTLHGLRRVPRTVTVDGVAYPVVTADRVHDTVLLGVPPFEQVVVEL